MKVFLPASVMGSLGTSQRKKERKKGKTEKKTKKMLRKTQALYYIKTLVARSAF